MRLDDTGSPRRRFVLGPGTIAALVFIVVLVLSGKLFDTRQQPDEPSFEVPPPSLDAPGPIPDVSYILDKKQVLSLDGSQIDKLSRISAMSEKQMDEINDALSGQTGNLDKIEGDAKSGNKPGVTSKELEQGADAMADTLKKASELRRKNWADANAVLTEEQRTKLESERQRDWAKTLKELSKERSR